MLITLLSERKSKQNIEETLILSVVLYVQKHGPCGKRIQKDLRLLKCEFGEDWRKSAGQNVRQMKKYWKRLEKKDPSYAQ